MKKIFAVSALALALGMSGAASAQMVSGGFQGPGLAPMSVADALKLNDDTAVVLVGQIEAVLAQRGGKILEHYELFDIYEGEQVKKGYKSVAYSLSFRAKDRTLEEADINAALKKILNGLEQLGIELRQ